MCVCLCICLQGQLPNNKSDLCMLPMAAAWSSSSVVMKSWEEAILGGFLPHWQCIVQHNIWDAYKNGWTDRDAVWDNEWAWPRNSVTWGWRSQKGGAILGKNVFDKPNTPIMANWTGPCSGTRRADAWLQALEKSIIGQGVGVYFRFTG